MILATRRPYRGFGELLTATVLAALITTGGKGLDLWAKYKLASEAEKQRAWDSLGWAPEYRRRYEELWARQAAEAEGAAPEPQPAGWPTWAKWAGVIGGSVLLGGIAFALVRR